MIRTRAALVLMCVASPLAAQGFEGTVTMNITGDNGTVRPISYMLKGGKMRFDPAGGQMSVIIDPASQRMMVIMNAQRMYMERDFGGAVAAAQQQAGMKKPTIVKTGKMETVAGYKCEHVTVTDDDGASVDSCISSELGGFRMPMASNPMAPQRESGWMTQLGGSTFPLKVSKGGKTILEVTAIEKKSLDAALFTAPEGYQSFQMPTMPKKPPQS
jgi:hypothetical protein